MKKFLLITAGILLASAINAQNYQLNSIVATDAYDSITFSYNSDNLLLANEILSLDTDGLTQLRDTLFYDDNNNIIRINTHQFLNNEWGCYTYLEYTYDENNNRITRTNYSDLWGAGFEKQGVYTYVYDENNRLISHEMTFPIEPFERAVYSYNEQGLLAQTLAEQVDFFSGQWQDSWKIEYEYDEAGNCILEKNYFYVAPQWEIVSRTERTYDEYGNCTVQTSYTRDNQISDRRTYYFNSDVTSDNITMPLHPESFFTYPTESAHMINGYSWEALNTDFELVYICDYLFDYTDVLGISQNKDLYNSVYVYPNPTADVINVKANDIKVVEIYDVNGRLVMRNDCANNNIESINVSDLNNGMYILRCFSGSQIHTQKIVINK